MNALAGTGLLLRFQGRRDALQLTVWVLGVALLAVGSAASVERQFDTVTLRTALLQVALITPSLLALRGVPNGTTIGSLEWFQLFAFLAVTVGLMNTFLAVRHGRGDEERGRRELLAATAVGRLAPVAATVLLAVGADAVLGALCGAGFAAVGLPGSGAVLAGGTLALTGVAFLGVGLVAGEVMPTSRSANGVAVAAVLLAYALRGAGDALGAPDRDRLTLRTAWPSWISPIGLGRADVRIHERPAGAAAADRRPGGGDDRGGGSGALAARPGCQPAAGAPGPGRCGPAARGGSAG